MYIETPVEQADGAPMSPDMPVMHLFCLGTSEETDNQRLLKASIVGGNVVLKTNNDTNVLRFLGKPLCTHRWYHICITHTRSLLQGSVVSLFINGALAGKVSLMTFVSLYVWIRACRSIAYPAVWSVSLVHCRPRKAQLLQTRNEQLWSQSIRWN